jgi:L-ribulose-5-phosphate 3-epimerase
MAGEIGFMQGRLSPLVDGRIQAFPWEHWREEFPLARSIGMGRMEWTLDHHGLALNPLMTPAGRAEIAQLSARHGVTVGSVTGDCFMQAPFWKARGTARQSLLDAFTSVVAATAALGARLIVVPLVDNGALETPADRLALLDGMAQLTPALRTAGVGVAFESDFPPADLAALIAGFPADSFGINFDIGNSASLGWDPGEELGLLAPRLVNVHVKDRKRGGTTVPLGEGDADLARVFGLLNEVGYAGDFILQTARAADDDHRGALVRYRDLVAGFIQRSAA